MNDKAKIVVAVMCLAIAALAVAWQMGAFKSAPKGADSVDEIENVDEAQPIPDSGVLRVPPAEPGGRGGLISQ